MLMYADESWPRDCVDLELMVVDAHKSLLVLWYPGQYGKKCRGLYVYQQCASHTGGGGRATAVVQWPVITK